ncbi:hypothetical protein IJD34_08765 [bacterium]|nr:hypothetical protein [bacterium]
MGNLFKLGSYTVTKMIRDSKGKFRNPSKEFISVLRSGKNTNIGKLTRASLVGMGKVVNLAKTPWFFGAMGLTALAAGSIGYLLGNVNNDKNDNTMGLVVERENPVETVPKEHIAKVSINEKNNYHQIKTGGMTWADIVQTYYPDLVEKCDNKLYGKDGAIRKLKEALQECCEENLLTMTDIPKTLNLPLELDGTKLTKNAEAKKEGISEKGGTTSVQEAGCKESELTYTVIDPTNDKEYTHPNIDTAIDSLKAATGVEEYHLDYAS